MKKNKFMRFASLLLIATLLTTSVISGTFAKYVTSDSAKDTARVAKFGVVASIEGNLFGPSYDSANGKIQNWGLNAESVSVYAANSAAAAVNNDIVAPGTKGDTLSFTVKGTPEVSTKVTFGDDMLNETGISAKAYDSDIQLAKGTYGVMIAWTGDITPETIIGKYSLTNGVYTLVETAPQTLPSTVYELKDIASVESLYLPLDWTIGGTEHSSMTVKDAKAEVKKAFQTSGDNPVDKTFKPNQANTLSQTITWDWDFEETNPLETGSIYYDNDKADTILGDMMADANDTTYAVVVSTGAKQYTTLKYATVRVGAADSSTSAYIAYLGETAPAVVAASGSAIAEGTYAVLTVNFTATLTVTQVD